MSKKNAKNNEPSQEEKRAVQLREMKKNDPVHLKQDIFRLRQQLVDIIQKRKGFERDLEEESKSYTQSTYKIQTEIKKQQDELISLEQTQTEQNEKFDRQLLRSKKNWQNELEAIIKDNQSKKNAKMDERKHWENKVKYLKQYPDRKIQYQMNISKLNAQLQRMRICQQKDITNIHAHHQKTRMQEQKKTEEYIQKIKQEEVHKLQEKMTKEQHIKKENQIMEQQIDLCEGQKKIIEEECEELKGEIENQKTKMSKDLLNGQANETYERSLRIIQLQGKVTKLKTYLSEQTTRLEKEYQKLDQLYNKQQQQINNKVTKIQGWLRMKERDLKKLKACSQMVLNQRSTLQSFLLQVFYEHPQIDHKDERNINKVLRYLFAKINSKKPPMNYKNFLPQSHNSMLSSIASNM